MSRLPIASNLRGLVALLLALLSALAHAEGGSSPLLFEVKSATNTVYLFGTIHVGARKLYPLSEAVESAFSRSRVLALEADPTDESGLVSAMTQAMYRSPDSLREHVPAPLYQRLEAVLPEVGLPIEYARNMKPFLLSMTLAMLEVQRLGYDAALGLDVHFAKRAKAQGTPIVELESMQEQIELFARMPADVQVGMLQLAIDTIQDGSLEIELDTLMTAWRAGDAAGIEASTRREMADLPPEVSAMLYARVYDERNRRMADKVAGFLASDQVHFVAVGAGHLTGESGLPVLLRAKGFAVRRL